METKATETRTYRPKGEGSIYKKSNGAWMYSIMHEGKRLTRSLKATDEETARRNLIKVRNNLMGRIDRGECDKPSSENFTIKELFESYLSHLRDNRKKSLKVNEYVINKIQTAREFLPARKVATLTTDDFKAYRKRETEAGKSHRTINYRFTLVRAALRLEAKSTPPRVAKVPHIPTVEADNVRQGFLEYDDHYSLLDALPQSLKALFVVAFHSGCRRGEVLNMRWLDVDWANRVIRLPETKNGKQWNLPFWGSIEDRLKKQKAYRDANHPECEHLFFWMEEDSQLSHGGRRNVPGSPIGDFRGSWASAVKEAHRLNPSVLANLLFHDVRRSGVRVMVQEAGIPEAQAMLISGHETRSMLERYNIVSLKNVQDAGAKLDAWSKARKPAKVAKGSKRRKTA
jgi:integrase